MVDTIQQILRPLLITCFIMGLSTYPVKQLNPRIQWITYLSILYCLAVWFLYACVFYYAVNFFTFKLLYYNTMHSIVHVSHMLTAVTFVIMIFYHQERFKITLKKLLAIEDTLKELGISTINHKMHTYLKLMVIGWIMYSIAVNFHDIMCRMFFKKSVSWGLLVPILLNHCIHINILVDLLFISLLWYIGTRFDNLNEYIQSLIEQEKYGLKCKRKKPISPHHHTFNVNNYKQILWTSMHLHLELCHITRELNFILGTHIAFEMGVFVLHITGICYSLCMMIMDQFQQKILTAPFVYLHTSFSFFILLIRLCTKNYICESVMIKANGINKIIHQLTNTPRYADVKKEIQQFILQVMYHPLKLTGMGLFFLGNDCLRKFCMTVVTYVIIMVQLKINIEPK